MIVGRFLFSFLTVVDWSTKSHKERWRAKDANSYEKDIYIQVYYKTLLRLAKVLMLMTCSFAVSMLPMIVFLITEIFYSGSFGLRNNFSQFNGKLLARQNNFATSASCGF